MCAVVLCGTFKAQCSRARGRHRRELGDLALEGGCGGADLLRGSGTVAGMWALCQTIEH